MFQIHSEIFSETLGIVSEIFQKHPQMFAKRSKVTRNILKCISNSLLELGNALKKTEHYNIFQINCELFQKHSEMFRTLWMYQKHSDVNETLSNDLKQLWNIAKTLVGMNREWFRNTVSERLEYTILY